MADPDAAPAADPQDWDGKAIVALMSLPHGRRLVERFLDYCETTTRLYRFDGDALGMAWRDGLADAGRFWESLLLHHCPDLYLRMIRERRARLEREQKKIAEKEQRRDPAQPATLMASDVEDRADAQRRAAEAATAAPRRTEKTAKPRD